MAKFELKFLDAYNSRAFIKVKKADSLRLIKIDLGENSIFLDESTAIKFAKTVRTEINKIKEV